MRSNSELMTATPVHLALQHADDALLHTSRIVIGVGDEDLLPVVDGNRLEGADEFREERICNVGDDEAEELGAPGAESLSIAVRVKVEFADRLADDRGGLGMKPDAGC